MSQDLELCAAGLTDVGQRPSNEDVVLIRSDLGLYVVADGAGGHR
jgi:PPM family protein phosphatase